LRLAVAVGLGIAVNVGYRALETPLVYPGALILLSILATVLATWSGRLLSGVTTLLITSGLLIYYLPPVRELWLDGLAEARLVLLFFAVGLVVAMVVDALQSGRTRGRALAGELEQLASSLLGERQRREALLANLPGIAWEARVERASGFVRLLRVSSSSGRLLGRSAEEMQGATLDGEELGERGSALIEAIRDVAAGGEARTIRHAWPLADGGVRWFDSHLAGGRDPESLEVRCVSIDVTDAETLERVVARTERRFREAMDQVPVLVWIARPGEGLVWTNQAWSSFRGRQEDGDLGFGWLEGVHPDEAERIDRTARAALDGRGDFHFEFRMLRADGAWRWLHWVGVPRLDLEGRFQDFLGFALDLSERRQLEMDRDELLAATERARDEAELAMRSRDEFLAKVSHELRNPLNGILGWSQILRRGEPSAEDLERGHEQIDLAARALVQLVDDLLDVSRIAAGKMRLSLAPTELKRVVEAACQTVTPSATARAIELDCTLDEDVVVMGDARRLQQVVWNLLANAVKFTPRGGRIEVSLRRDADERAVLSVRDTGIGIDPEFLPQVFAPFSQQESTSTRRFRGLGLGLSIARNLVELHGGSIAVRSDGADRGSTFEVSLPVTAWRGAAPERTEAGLEETGGVVPRPLRGLRILLVDDDDGARELLARILEPTGARVHTAASAADGLASIIALRPDVLVSDIEMPGTDGIGFLRRVRALAEEEGGAIPAVALTAYVRDEERERILLAGFQAHLGKPVDADALVRVLAGLRPGSLPAPN
jgi:PAS domain S-box-containing protein